MIAAYDGLTRRERQIADLLLDNPVLTLLSSASDLAQMANVSNSTMTRFVKSLDFETYDATRRETRDQSGQGSPLNLIGQRKPHQPTDVNANFSRKEAKIVENPFSNLDRNTIENAAERLVAARQIGFLGMRNSHFFSSYAHWQFVQFRPGTRLISGAGETSAEHLAGFNKDDEVVIVGIRRIVSKLRACIDILADSGVDILLIADSSSLSLAHRARWTTVCPIGNEHVFDSCSSVLGVLRLLAFIALQKTGDEGLAYMASIENHHDRLNEL
ncbi:MurR/RpiR family transcriptional regulator [Epibacterium ulvae]|uniref:MurR/RpiR family transcriptional regulator n=1 Tax=Epibacterium ulvae TaxID=1156985 RepID=UPI002490BCE2|nr:MurR/RpiR family transcriptional regulator [Epibacterium ulvae]